MNGDYLAILKKDLEVFEWLNNKGAGYTSVLGLLGQHSNDHSANRADKLLLQAASSCGPPNGLGVALGQVIS